MLYDDILNEEEAARNQVYVFFIIAYTQEEAQKQLDAELQKSGINPADIVPIGGGGYTTTEGLEELKRIHSHKAQRIKNELIPNKAEFKKAIIAELFNYEYIYSYDLATVLNCFNLTEEEAQSNPEIKATLAEALEEYQAAAM